MLEAAERKRKGKGFIWTENEIARFTSMWNRGVAVKQIMHDIGKSYTSIKSYRAYLGLTPRKQPGVKSAQRKHRFSVYLNEDEYKRVVRRAHERQQGIGAYLMYLVRRDIA